jgi:LysR family transcriptional regulator, transcriptional activator of the cysJI operon
VTIEHLKLFRDIVAARSVSRGAESSGVSQSAASQQLHEAEGTLGVQLLDRSSRPFELTEAGVLYYEFCRDVLRRRDELDQALGQIRGRMECTVRVAAIYSVGLSDMSRLEAELSRRMPEAKLQVEYLRPEKVYDAVVGDQTDLGIISYPESNREIVAVHWRDERMMLAAAPFHPLAAKSSVTLAEVAEQDFVAFDDDLRVGREVKRYLKENGARVNVVMHFDNVQTMKEAVALGASVSILPVRVLRNDISQGRLVAIPIEGCTLVRPLGIIHRRRKKFHAGTQTFLDLLQQEAATEAAVPV